MGGAPLMAAPGLQAGRKRVKPIEDNDLSALRVVFSTGSPLMPEDFEYVYTRVKEDVRLAGVTQP